MFAFVFTMMFIRIIRLFFLRHCNFVQQGPDASEVFFATIILIFLPSYKHVPSEEQVVVELLYDPICSLLTVHSDKGILVCFVGKTHLEGHMINIAMS
jgi:hypothetical protein